MRRQVLALTARGRPRDGFDRLPSDAGRAFLVVFESFEKELEAAGGAGPSFYGRTNLGVAARKVSVGFDL